MSEPLAKVDEALGTLEAAVREFEKVYQSNEDDLTVDDYLALLIRLRDVIGRARYTEDALVYQCQDLPAFQNVVVPGLGVAQPKWGKDRKAWDHKGLANVVGEKILVSFVDPETGTIDAPYAVLVTEILKYAHADYWRKGELAKLGIDVDDYCEQTKGKFSIQTTPNESPGA